MNKSQESVIIHLGDQTEPNGPVRDYLVTVFKALKSGDLYALVLRVCVAEPIEWVRAHVDEIVAVGVQQDSLARQLHLPIVALNVQSA